LRFLSRFGFARTSSRRRESRALARKSIKPWNYRDFQPAKQLDALRSTGYFDAGAGAVAVVAGAVLLDFFLFFVDFVFFLVVAGFAVSVDAGAAVVAGAVVPAAGAAGAEV
jgi:hypothetical protein